MRRVGAIIAGESSLAQRARQAFLQADKLGLRHRGAQPRDTASLKASDLVECHRERRAVHALREYSQRGDPIRALRAEKGEREMDALSRGGPAARLPCNAACEIRERAAERSVRPERKENAQGSIGHAAQYKTNGTAPVGVPRRNRDRRFSQPLATDSSAFGFSKNCSSSVEPLSAVVDDCPAWTVCVTASK